MMDEQGTVNANVFMTLIHSIHKEDEQKKWLINIFPKDSVEQMYSLSDEKQMELNSKMAKLIDELKETYDQDYKSPAVQTLIERYFALALEVYPGTMELVEKLQDQEIDIEDNIELFPSPFTPQEEEWIAKAMQYYWEQRGVNLYGES